MSGSLFVWEGSRKGEHNWYEDQLEGLSSVSLRLTASSAEGVKGPRLRTRKDFASAEARRWTEAVWQLSDRPRHPCGPPFID